MDYDMASNLKGLPAIAPAIYTTTQTSAALDTNSYLYKALSMSIYIGVGGITFTATNRVDFQVTHSDDNVTYVAVLAGDVIIDYTSTLTLPDANGTVKSLVAAHAAADVTLVGYVGKKRYVKIAATFGGTHATGTTIGIDWVLGKPMSKPNWQTQYPDMV